MENTKGQQYFTKESSHDYGCNEQHTRNLNYNRDHQSKTTQQFEDVNWHQCGENYNGNQCYNDHQHYDGGQNYQNDQHYDNDQQYDSGQHYNGGQYYEGG